MSTDHTAPTDPFLVMSTDTAGARHTMIVFAAGDDHGGHVAAENDVVARGHEVLATQRIRRQYDAFVALLPVGADPGAVADAVLAFWPHDPSMVRAIADHLRVEARTECTAGHAGSAP